MWDGNNRNITSSSKQHDNDGRTRSNSNTSASAFGSPRPPTSSHHVPAEWELCVCDVEETLMPILTKFLCAISVVVPVADVAEQDTRKFHCQKSISPCL